MDEDLQERAARGAHLGVRRADDRDADGGQRARSRGPSSTRSPAPGVKSCDWRTNRPEPGYLRLSGIAYTSSAPGAKSNTLNLLTGRQHSQLRPTRCSYIEANWAKFSRAPIEPGEGLATGYLDTRKVVLALELPPPQQAGLLAFPVDHLHAGAGFVLDLNGKTKDHVGLRKTEGTARITFVPQPS